MPLLLLHVENIAVAVAAEKDASLGAAAKWQLAVPHPPPVPVGGLRFIQYADPVEGVPAVCLTSAPASDSDTGNRPSANVAHSAIASFEIDFPDNKCIACMIVFILVIRLEQLLPTSKLKSISPPRA